MGMPDSPPCLLRRGKLEASRAALQALEPQSDLDTIDTKILEMEENMMSDQIKTSWLETLKLLKKGSNFKPLLICMNLFLALHLCGMGPFIFFSSRFFKLARSCVSAGLASVIVGAINFLTVFIVGIFGKKTSRRKMMIISQFGVSVCLILLSLYFFLDKLHMADSIRWGPLLVMIIYFIALNLGLASYVWVIVPEIIPEQIRPTLLPASVLASSFLWFLVTYFFNALITLLGGAYLFLFYGLISLLFSLISLAFLPETTGKTSQEIEKVFEKKKELNRIGNIKENDL